MAKLFGCRICMVDCARVELADGTVALVCASCDVIGMEHEVAQGGPLWTLQSAARRGRPPQRARNTPPRSR